MTSPARSTNGFTLLEVILALTALALLTGICYAAFSLATRAVERGANAVVTEQRLRAVTDVIMREVKSAVPYPLRDPDAGIVPYFRCSGQSVSFITASGQLAGGVPAWVRYEVEGDPPALHVYETPVFDPDSLGRNVQDPETTVEATAIDGFTSLTFSCLDLTNGWGTLVTTDEDSSQELALSVNLRFEGLPGLPGVFEQKIPLVLPSYSEEGGGVDEEEEERLDAVGEPETDDDDQKSDKPGAASDADDADDDGDAE
jgi:prepilin-type N-terminal cleavage/methylation domain-containing protein